MIRRALEDEAKREFQYAAYIGWQLGQIIPAALGAQNDKFPPFSDYLKKLGLGNDG